VFSIDAQKIRDQVLVLTLLPLLSLLSAFVICFYFYWMVRDADRETRIAEESIARGESVLRQLTDMSMSVQTYIRSRDPTLLDTYSTGARDVDSAIARLQQLELEGVNPSEADQVETIRAEIHHWMAGWADPTIVKVQNGQAFNWEAAESAGRNLLKSPRARLLGLIELDRGQGLAATRKVEIGTSRFLLLGLGVSVFLLAAMIYMMRALTSLIVQPVRQLIEASEQVSRGDFQPMLPPPVDNEFGLLSRSFAHMTTALRRGHEEMEALNRFSEVVAECTSEQEVYDHLLHSLRERFEARQAIIFKLNAAENFLEAAATLLPLPAAHRTWPVIEEPHQCKAIRSGRLFRTDDVTREPLCPSKFALPAEGSYYCGPLIAGGIIIGAVRVEGLKGAWTPERERLFESYLSGAASALSNLRLLDTAKQQATVDMLTGLYNRRFLEDYTRKLLAMARRRQQCVGVIILDLDHFKSFNDIYGHEVGDRILREFAKTAIGTMRETNLAARFGGDEFVVVLPDTSSKTCLPVAERIRQAVMQMVIAPTPDKVLPQVTVSLGIAAFPEHGQTFEEVLLAADKALYESKRAGHNRTTLYAPMVQSES